MIVYFDKYFYKSTAASALLLKRRIDLDWKNHEGNYVVFSTTLKYKKAKLENDGDDVRLITKYFLKFSSVFSMYIGFYLYYFLHRKNITMIVSQSSPGFNLLFFAFSPFRKKVNYIVQDVYPDGFLEVLNLNYLLNFLRPFLRIAYSRLLSVETISSDMYNYLEENYRIKANICYNPNVYPDHVQVKVLDRENIVFGYSGNFSYSHGIKYPTMLLEMLAKRNDVEIHIRGFGKYYELCKERFLNSNIFFGSGMGKKEYLEYLESLDVLLLFQEWGYEKYCLSCKFNTVIELMRPIIYVGPECDISRYILGTSIGIVFTDPGDFVNLENNFEEFITNLDYYISKAQSNRAFNLNTFFCDIHLSN